MDPQKQYFRPDAIQVSKLHFYSLGIVAENKALKSDIIEVTPIEELTMLDGEINADTVDVSASGQDVSGTSYTTNVKTGNSIQAKWLKHGQGNRTTAPDVRRGAQVVIYQFGDADKYYWTTLMDDQKLRKLETVIWAFSGTKDEGTVNGPDNTYFFEISTHTGLVTFHTSVSNEEFTTWDIQLNTKEGKLTITDGVGQYLMIDAQAHTIHLENVEGSYLDITKEIMSMFTKDQINMETQTMNFKARTANYNLDTLNLKDTNLNVTADTTVLKLQDTTWTGNTLNATIGEVTIAGTTMEVTTETVTFEGIAFIVLSPAITLA